MARPKEFDRADALGKAMQVFWEKGYEATSVQDLVNGMGINRGSLYDTFGDKHSLFLDALDHFAQLYGEQSVKLLDGESSGRKAIEKLFCAVVCDCCDDCEGLGCFLTNSAVELCNRCPKTAQKVADMFSVMEEALYRAAKRGKDCGEIRSQASARELARFFSNTLMGLRVRAKTQPSKRELSDIVNLSLSVMG